MGSISEVTQFFESARGLINVLGVFWGLAVATWALFKLREIRVTAQEIKGAIADLKATDVKGNLEEILKLQVASREQARTQAEVTAERDEVEAQAQVLAPQPAVNWDQLRTIWNEIANEIRRKAAGIEDGRLRRKYPRDGEFGHDYSETISLLQSDGELTDAKASAAKMLNREYLSKRNRRKPVTEADLANARQWAADFRGRT